MPKFVHDQPCCWTPEPGSKDQCRDTPTAYIGDIYYACEEHFEEFQEWLESEDVDADWSVEDYIDDLKMQVEALETDLDDNHPESGPNYAYALGDLRSIREDVDALLEKVSVTVRVRPDYGKPDVASDGREVRVPKDVTTVSELNSVLGLKAGHELHRIIREAGEAEPLGDAEDPVVLSEGDEFTIVETTEA
ncbi:hypothetical protein U3A55_11890 [Salarchaeum sp. III]|uniref:hypothetical protein n=1 Tax=Salarchaeum sp. III TaxID=3107927 RepID=UPI002ED83FA9